MRKQSSLMALIGTHIAQNVVGARMVNSDGFQKKITQDLLAGATGRRAHHGQIMDHVNSAGLAVAVPEGAIMKNMAYEHGQKIYKNLRLEGIDPNKLDKRDLAIARMELEGRGHILNSRGLGDNPIVKSIRNVMGFKHINGRIDSEVLRNVRNLPMGNTLPHSRPLMAASNTALSAVDATTAALNGGKLLMDTKQFTNSRLGHFVEKKFTIDPIKDAINKGADGIMLNPKVIAAKKYIMNGAMGQLEENANKFGLTNGPQAKNLVEHAKSLATSHKSVAHKITAENGTMFAHLAETAASKAPASPMGKKLFRYAMRLAKV